MGMRIVGAPTAGTQYSLQGDVTLTITPQATLNYQQQIGTLGDPVGYNDLLAFLAGRCVTAANNSIAQPGPGQQYDGVKVYRFCRLHSGTAQPFRNAEVAVRDGYINNYIIGNNYRPAAHLQYPMGLYYNYVDHGHQLSIDVLDTWLDSINWSYNDASTGHDERRHQIYSREIAYSVLSLVMLEKAKGVGNTNLTALGKDVVDRYPFLVTCMENHLYQWRNNDYSDPAGVSGFLGNYAYMNPFMVGITCFTLAQYYEWNQAARGNGNIFWPTTNWPSIPAAVEDVLQWLMDTAVVPPGNSFAGERLYRVGSQWGGPTGAGAFYYIDRDTSGIGSPGSTAEDLNCIILPAYAWIAKHKGDASWILNRADKLFHGLTTVFPWVSVTDTSSTNLRMKQFNQSLYWAEEYFDWRAQV